MEVGGEEHAGRRQSEANGAESETFLFTEIIRHGSGSSAADDAPDEGAPGGPSCARRGRVPMRCSGSGPNQAGVDTCAVDRPDAVGRAWWAWADRPGGRQVAHLTDLRLGSRPQEIVAIDARALRGR